MNFSSAGRPTLAFDYCELPGTIQGEVREAAGTIRRLLQRGSQDVVQIGLRLQVVRNTLGRERFPRWLESEFSWSRSLASKHMCVARVFAHRERLEGFQSSALYVLARRSVSPLAREEAFRLAREGQFISKARAQDLARRYGSPRKQRPLSTSVRRRLVERLKQLPLAEVESIADELLSFLSRSAAR